MVEQYVLLRKKWSGSLSVIYSDQILIGRAFLSTPALWSPYVSSRSVCIISDSDIAAYYLSMLERSCREAGARQVNYFLVPSGETSKTLSMAAQIWDFLIEHEYDRDSVLIALGGGVVGDLAGFSAACYLRGISVIQCPTTLLGQIDAAIGGKAAINHARGKNLIGAFHMPEAVVIDIDTLQTLPDKELRAAMGELIKYGLIADAEFFIWIEENIERVLRREAAALEFAIRRAVNLKMRIVSQDERDRGLRAILNFGHTVGHAIESLLNYSEWRHGEAIAVGMVVALHLSCQRNKIDEKLLERLIALLNRINLPNKLPRGITNGAILAKIKQDKKHSQGNLPWVLLKALGSACPGNIVLPEEIHQALTFVQI